VQKADFYLIRDGVEHFFEIKTVKPNIDVFAKSKVKLLEWVARRRDNVNVFLVFPYNPYHPKPYERFTLQNLMVPGEDILIAEQFWNFLGGSNAYEQLLEIFNNVGIEYKDRIAEKIRDVAENKHKLN